VDAGLTARALAAAAAWDRTQVSQIEHARRPASPQDIRTWCRICGAEEQATDLVESLQAAEGMWIEWRRMERTGLRHAQEAVRPLLERTRMFRGWLPGQRQDRSVLPAVLIGICDLVVQ